MVADGGADRATDGGTRKSTEHTDSDRQLLGGGNVEAEHFLRLTLVMRERPCDGSDRQAERRHDQRALARATPARFPGESQRIDWTESIGTRWRPRPTKTARPEESADRLDHAVAQCGR